MHNENNVWDFSYIRYTDLSSTDNIDISLTKVFGFFCNKAQLLIDCSIEISH